MKIQIFEYIQSLSALEFQISKIRRIRNMQTDKRAHRNLTLSFGNFGKDITNKANSQANKPASMQNAQSRNLSEASERFNHHNLQVDCKQTQNIPPQDNVMTFRGSRKEASSEKMTFGIQFSPSQKPKGKSSQRQDPQNKLTASQMQLLNFKDYLSGSMRGASSTKSLVTSKYIPAKEYQILQTEEHRGQNITRDSQIQYTFNSIPSNKKKRHDSTYKHPSSSRLKSLTQVLSHENNFLALAPQHPTKGNSLVSVTDMRAGQSHGSKPSNFSGEQFFLNGLSQSQKSKGSRISHVTQQSGKDDNQMSQIEEIEVESIIPTEGQASISHNIQSMAQNQQLNQNSGYFGQDYHREFAENPTQFEVFNNLQQISSLEISQISKQSGQTYNGHLSQLKMFSPSNQPHPIQDKLGKIQFLSHSPKYLNDPDENIMPTNSSKIESEDFNEFGSLSHFQNDNQVQKQQTAFQDPQNYFSHPTDNQSKQSPLEVQQYQIIEKNGLMVAQGFSDCQQQVAQVENQSICKSLSPQSFVDRSYLKNIQQVPMNLSMADTQRSITENVHKPATHQNQKGNLHQEENRTTERHSPDGDAQIQTQGFNENTKVINDVIDNGFQAQDSTENLTLGRISYSNRNDSQACTAGCFPQYDKFQVQCEQPPQVLKGHKSEGRNVRQQLELQQELQASPSRVISDDQQMFHSHHSVEKVERLNPLNTYQNSVQQSQSQNDLSSYNIMSNIFYKAFENTKQEDVFVINQENQQIKIWYQMMCFNSIQAMEAQVQPCHQQSVDSGKTKQICMEIIEIDSQLDGVQDKKRRMYYLNILPKIKITEYSDKRVHQINLICDRFQNQETECFEQVYNTLNEQFINEIIDTECERQTKKLDGDQMNFLLISEDNLETQNAFKCEQEVTQNQVIQSQKTTQRSEQRQSAKQQSGSIKKMPLHEMLYKESEMKEKEKRIKSKERELQMLKDEVKECSFTPRPYEGSGSQRRQLGSGSQAKVQNGYDCHVKGKSLKFGQLGSGDKEACSIRSPEKFYNDMMEFKLNKEGKLEQIRNEEALNSVQIATFGGGTLRNSIEQRNTARKIQAVSPKEKQILGQTAIINGKIINLKELAHKHALTVSNKAHSNAAASPIMPVTMFKKQVSSRSYASPKSMDSKTTLNKNADIPYSNTKSRLSSHKVRSAKNAMAISEHLYNDAQKRDNKREKLKSHYDKEQKRLTKSKSKASYVKSINILANKIAMRTKDSYDAIVEDYVKQFNVQQELSRSKGRINTISEQSQESENASWAAGVPQSVKKVLNGLSKDEIEGITFEQFIQLMQKLKYMSDAGEDIHNMNSEMAGIDRAWKLLAHFETGHPQRVNVISLRNLIIFLIAIENLYIESMSLNDLSLIPQANMFTREEREVGFFLGSNYFLDDQNDSRKLAQIYSIFAKNRATFEKSNTLQQRKSQERMNVQNFSGKSRSCERENIRIPAINKKSDQIMRQKLKDFYSHRVVKDIGSGKITTFKGQAPFGMQKLGSKYEDFLIQKGNQTKIKIQQKLKEQEKQETVGCTFMPKINKNYKSRSLQSHSHRGFHYEESEENSLQDTQNDYPRGRNILTQNQNRINLTKNLKTTALSRSQVLKNQNVFENLYKVAEKRQEITLESQKNSRIIQLEKLRKECTFRPNLNKTQSMNKQVNSRLYHYNYKDPEILKEQFNNTQQIDFKALSLKTNRTHQGFLSNSIGHTTLRSSGIRTNVPGTARGFVSHEQEFLNTQKIEISNRLQKNNEIKQKKQKINRSLAQKFIVQKNVSKLNPFPSSRDDPSTLRGYDHQLSTNNEHLASINMQTQREQVPTELSTISQVNIQQTIDTNQNSVAQDVESSRKSVVASYVASLKHQQYQKQFSAKSVECSSKTSSRNGSQQRLSRNGSSSMLNRSNGSKKQLVKRYDNFEQAQRQSLPILFNGKKKSITDTLCMIRNPLEVNLTPTGLNQNAPYEYKSNGETETGQTTWVQVSGPESTISQKQCRVDQPKVINQAIVYQKRYEVAVDEFEHDIEDEEQMTPDRCTPNSNLRSEDTPIKIEDFNPLLTGPCTYPLQLQNGQFSNYQ